MIMPSPEQIRFESMCDLVDYTCKGLPPRKKDFQKVIVHCKIPDCGPRDPKEVYVDSSIIPEDPETRELMISMLERAYEDRRKNMQTLLVVGGLVLLVVGGVCYFSRKKDKDVDNNDRWSAGNMSCENLTVDCENLTI